MTCHVESELGAYVLGALEPEEVEVVSEHLTTCHTCSAEAESLAATAGLLALLRAKDFEQLGVPDPEQGRSGPEARSGRRRTSPRRAGRGG
jgi:anti-sigma factor RsiW